MMKEKTKTIKLGKNNKKVMENDNKAGKEHYSHVNTLKDSSSVVLDFNMGLIDEYRIIATQAKTIEESLGFKVKK